MSKFFRLMMVLLLVLGTSALLRSQNASIQETITVSAIAAGFSQATLDLLGTRAVCRGRLLDANQLLADSTVATRYFYHGATPTATNGELLDLGDRIKIDNLGNILNFKIIKATGSGDGRLVMTCAAQ